MRSLIMGVSIVVGGQYGSEGKGKVANTFANKLNAVVSMRVGGTNSGHTVYHNGIKFVLKVLPAAAVGNNCKVVIPSGQYIDLNLLYEEMDLLKLDKDSLKIDPFAVIITEDHVKYETSSDMNASIGSTQSGTGAAVISRIKRNGPILFAKDIVYLSQYLSDTKQYLRSLLDNDENIVIEGTQGFGLSVLHSNEYPYVTARDTTAASVLSEVGLSPFDVDHIILVIRAYPIRVGGNSGFLKNEVNWDFVTNRSGSKEVIKEYTSVTNRIRRVAEFDSGIVKRAISVNKPDIIVMNHLDYINSQVSDGVVKQDVIDFVLTTESDIGRKIDLFGVNNTEVLDRSAILNKEEKYG